MSAVTMSADNDFPGVVAIYYSSDTTINAFGLELSLSNGARFEDIYNYFTGDSNGTRAGYGIFLDIVSGIKISPAGEVLDWGIPVVGPNSVGAAGTGMGTDKIILEMGALYSEGNEPALSGLLCKVAYSGPECSLTIAGNSRRRNIVLQNSIEVTGNMPVSIPLMSTECFPSDHPDYNQWAAVGKPDCWCYPRQCLGDTNNNKGVGDYWVSSDDLEVLLAAWQKKYSQMAGQTHNGIPWICADFDHQIGGGPKLQYRVSPFDLNILLANWNQTNKPDPNCP